MYNKEKNIDHFCRYIRNTSSFITTNIFPSKTQTPSMSANPNNKNRVIQNRTIYLPSNHSHFHRKKTFLSTHMSTYSPTIPSTHSIIGILQKARFSELPPQPPTASVFHYQFPPHIICSRTCVLLVPVGVLQFNNTQLA